MTGLSSGWAIVMEFPLGSQAAKKHGLDDGYKKMMVYFWDGLLVDGCIGNRAGRSKSRVSRLVSFYRLENDNSRKKISKPSTTRWKSENSGRLSVCYRKHLIKVRIDFGGMFLNGMLRHTTQPPYEQHGNFGRTHLDFPLWRL